MKINKDITIDNVAKAMEILHDNGIEIEVCEYVMREIGHALLDVELQPMIDEFLATEEALENDMV